MLLKKGLPKVLGFSSEAIHAYRGRSKGTPKQDNTAAFQLPPGTYAPSCYFVEDCSEVPNGYTTEDSTWIPAYFYAPDGSWIPNDSNLPAESVARISDTPASGARGVNARALKAAEAGFDPDEHYPDGIHEDEAVWQLDEMTESLAPPGYEESLHKDNMKGEEETGQTEDEKIKKRERLVRELMNMAGPAPNPSRRLPYAVIIPQRRPGTKGRGFCRAYAPILAESGIDQDTFLQFIQSFDKANTANPIIEVTFIAAGILGFVPNATAQIVGAVVQIAAGIAKELQARNRANTFLDRVNQEIFMPRGLVAMIMAFKNDDCSGFGSIKKLFHTEKVDINDPNAGNHDTIQGNPYDHLNEAATSHNIPQEGEGWWKRNVKKIRETNGQTKGDVQLPESGPLVYPYLDAAIEQNSEAPQGFTNKMGAAGDWVQDYMDRKSHANLERDKPGTSLAMSSDQRKPFKSRFNDPDHPANSGSLISVITGGAIAMPSRQQMLTSQLRRLKGGADEEQTGRRKNSDMGLGLMSTVKKMKKYNIFYLTVINMPTQEEIDAATAQLGELGQDMPAQADPAAEITLPASGSPHNTQSSHPMPSVSSEAPGNQFAQSSIPPGVSEYCAAGPPPYPAQHSQY
ncbi:hypothetical protein N7540_007739 [Penicillium herquei]|nr:hypothetical protein N7540_007739 [Penicillium herquei]